MRGRTGIAAALVALVALAATAGSAQAVHWPFFGGDNGRSGYQPVGEGTAPVRFLYSRTSASDQFIKTSVLTTTGIPASQRVIYGTVNPQEVMAGAPANANGRVHLRTLQTGEAVGPEAGVKIDDGLADADVYGPGAMAPAPASVSFADTSGASGLGQLFAVHNDDDQSPNGDIAVAQIDETSGALVQQVSVAGTDGFSIRSSVVATGPAPDGSRVLFFVAENGDDQRLFRVPVSNAGSPSAQFGGATSTPDIDADPQASPTIVFLRSSGGAPTGYVAVGTAAPASNVRTFSIATLAAGPASGDLGDDVQTPSVPIQPSGATPSPSGPVTTAPALYVAARVGDSTQVHRLVQDANAQTLTTAGTSPALAGAPAPALATDQQSEPDALEPGRIVVTTGQNLYVLATDTLAVSGSFSDAALAPGTTGFGQPTAAVSGPLAYVTNDEGEQFVVGLDDAKPVAPAAFTEDGANAPPRLDNSGMGQPSISRSFVQFASQKGLFVYTNACGNDSPGTPGDDRIFGSLGGDNTNGLEGDDKISADRGDDCIFGGAGNDAVSGNEGEDSVHGDDGEDGVFGRDGDDGVSGNGGDDVVRGGDGEDRVFGRDGDDRISGNGGDDRVAGGPGRDRIFGRAGDDRILARDGARDTIDCGTGDDSVVADELDTVAGNCEAVKRG